MEVEVAWPRRAGSSEPAAVAAAEEEEGEGEDEPEEVGEESPEGEAGGCAVVDIRVCARVWRNEGGEQREEEPIFVMVSRGEGHDNHLLWLGLGWSGLFADTTRDICC